MTFLTHMQHWLSRACGFGVVCSMAFILPLTLLNIMLRWYGSSLLWIDPLVRHLVFLMIFFGGVLATQRKGHMAIDLCGKWLEQKGPRYHFLYHKTISLVCTLGVSWLLLASLPFVQMEWQYGRESFLNIHSGYLVAIIPAGLSLLALSFLLQLILEPQSTWKP